MRKSLWIVPLLLVLVAAISAPNAQADSFTYIYTDTLHGISWTTAAIPAVTMATLVAGTDLTKTSNTGNFASCVTTSVVLDVSGVGATATNFATCNPNPFQAPDGFTLMTIALREPTFPR